MVDVTSLGKFRPTTDKEQEYLNPKKDAAVAKMVSNIFTVTGNNGPKPNGATDSYSFGWNASKNEETYKTALQAQDKLGLQNVKKIATATPDEMVKIFQEMNDPNKPSQVFETQFSKETLNDSIAAKKAGTEKELQENYFKGAFGYADQDLGGKESVDANTTPLLKAMDVNGDGKVSRVEAAAAAILADGLDAKNLGEESSTTDFDGKIGPKGGLAAETLLTGNPFKTDKTPDDIAKEATVKANAQQRMRDIITNFRLEERAKNIPAQQAPEAAPESVKKNDSYKVEKGDTLWKIVQQYREENPDAAQGKSFPEHLKEIAKLNGIEIKQSGFALIKKGDEIKFS